MPPKFPHTLSLKGAFVVTLLLPHTLSSKGATVLSFADVNGDILPLRSAQLKLLQLKARQGERIACSAISQDGSIVAFSDQEKIRVHKVALVSP